jgi:hypothetical protein
MTRRMVLLLVLHGLLLLVVGMLVGLGFGDAITRHAGPDAERAWRVAHTSLMGLGALYLAMAAVAHTLVLSPRVAALAAWFLVVGAYASAVAFTLGPAVGARGLQPVGPPLHVAVFAVLNLAVLLVFVATLLFLWGAYTALRAERE